MRGLVVPRRLPVRKAFKAQVIIVAYCALDVHRALQVLGAHITCNGRCMDRDLRRARLCVTKQRYIIIYTINCACLSLYTFHTHVRRANNKSLDRCGKPKCITSR
jgi:hypothetical protein